MTHSVECTNWQPSLLKVHKPTDVLMLYATLLGIGAQTIDNVYAYDNAILREMWKIAGFLTC